MVGPAEGDLFAKRTKKQDFGIANWKEAIRILGTIAVDQTISVVLRVDTHTNGIYNNIEAEWNVVSNEIYENE